MENFLTLVFQIKDITKPNRSDHVNNVLSCIRAYATLCVDFSFFCSFFFFLLIYFMPKTKYELLILIRQFKIAFIIFIFFFFYNLRQTEHETARITRQKKDKIILFDIERKAGEANFKRIPYFSLLSRPYCIYLIYFRHNKE
jgi:hypothetical protein